MEILNVKGLTFFYPGTDKSALTDIDFSVNEGELVLVCGNSGSGKTTLLRSLKPQTAPHGTRSGKIMLGGVDIDTLDNARTVAEIGFCSQSPELQQVCDTVYRELAFGLENLGTEPRITAKRIAETSMFFGIDKLFPKKLSELSGGERQIVNLAAICAMRPGIIILDEPTAQLSPVAASTLIDLLQRLKRELGITVIMTEHRTEELFPIADKIIYLDGGKIVAEGTPEATAEKLCREYPQLLQNLPAPVRVYSMKPVGKLPVTLAQGRDWLKDNADAFTVKPQTSPEIGETVLKCKNLCFAFDRTANVIMDLNFSVGKGEFFCLLGGNGAGKTTLLRLLAGILKPISGKLKVNKSAKFAYLPQNVMPMFLHDTLKRCLPLSGTPKDAELLELFDLTDLQDKHPYDLSAGELQRAALCKLVMGGADIYLLDEPTKGVDNTRKQQLAVLLKTLCREGKTIVCVTHDIDFAAENADRAAFLFNGSVPESGDRVGFFSDNIYCSTAAYRLTRNIIDGCVTVSDLAVMKGNECL